MLLRSMVITMLRLSLNPSAPTVHSDLHIRHIHEQVSLLATQLLLPPSGQQRGESSVFQVWGSEQDYEGELEL